MTAPACGSCGSPVADQARLCSRCTRDLAAALELAASIAADLDDAVARLLRRGGGFGGRPSEPPLPFDVAASDAADGLRKCLLAAAAAVRDGTWPGSETADLAAWLLGRLEAARQHEAAPLMLAAVRLAVARAVRVIDRLPERAPAGTCESCGAPLLAEVGADSALCRCGTRAEGITARRAARAAAADVLGTPGEISGALFSLGIVVSSGTIRKWASRGRLAGRPGSTPDRPVYAMSEVLHLCAQRDTGRQELTR